MTKDNKLLGRLEANLKNIAEDITEIKKEVKKIAGIEIHLKNHLKKHETMDTNVRWMFKIIITAIIGIISALFLQFAMG